MKFVDVIKTFDIFNTETLRFLATKALNIFAIETPNSKINGVNLSQDKNSINISVVNRPKTYNLLICAQKKLEERRAKTLMRQ